MITKHLSSWAQRCASAFVTNGKLSSTRRRHNDHATKTSISQTLDQVLERVARDEHESILVVGSEAFRNAIAAADQDLKLGWASCNMNDVFAGAMNPDEVDFRAYQSAICGGAEVSACYRIALQRMYEADDTRPVHWVADNWEFCGGTFPVPAEIDDAEVVLFNHFQHFFGIKDHLQFQVQVSCGSALRSFYRILGPNESLVMRLSDYFPDRTEAAAFSSFVQHPSLTRGRHNRLRMCGDVFWRGSLTTLHGLHEFNRSPSHKFEFRLSIPDLHDGDVVLTIPNYARDMVDTNLVTQIDDQRIEGRRKAKHLVDQAYINSAKLTGHQLVGWNYSGYGGSNWFAMASAIGPHRQGSIAGNHHASVPVETMPITPMEPTERDQINMLRQNGYFLEPYALPVTRLGDSLSFGFNCGSANPPYRDFILHIFDAGGRLLGEHSYQKNTVSTVYTEDLPNVANDDRASLVMLTPDFERIGTRRKGFKTQFEHVVRHRQSGDWDVTEGQTSWRNAGIAVPSAGHFAGPLGSVVGRTNLMARARTGNDLRTGIVAIHASGRIGYSKGAELRVTVLACDGARREATVSVPSFTWRYIWLDELWPDLGSFLDGDDVGPLQNERLLRVRETRCLHVFHSSQPGNRQRKTLP